ncbi:MAG: GNAT family N-acetyltransferase [Gammaproteobacteria bacterium]|nr:GNAT family N-acetyltransferase [Gammaproteobacteria bacterium]MBU1732881.1 GNAT family N-acetyltransferase [Gammaproteobacteria bacterium]MBU1893185.1 GNAT family N-acetyltransferase [Gammaproteobacteria bacterium]
MLQVPTLRIIETIKEIPAPQWDALAGSNPFLSHAFLSALQESGCATPETGWSAQFLTLWQADVLVGAMPLYLKSHSWGEFVFDWAWAEAYQRAGLEYYPKLLCAVPFTPVTGLRLLAPTPELRAALVNAALRLAQEMGVSSLHCLFPPETEAQEMQQQGMMLRRGVQFHWRNPGYADFDAYLASMSHDKRKRIKQERRKVKEAGITFERLSGASITAAHWEFFNRCFVNTHLQYNSPQALNLDFFRRIGASMADNILLVIAVRDGHPIASALNFYNQEALFGRSWGALEYHPGLHFEACYYQAIEFCIERGIPLFEGGAQGEHKLSRGFLPETTWSAHWLAHPRFAQAVDDFLKREMRGMRFYMDELNERSPFKQGVEK